MMSHRDRGLQRIVRLAAVALALLPAAARGADIVDLQPFKDVSTATINAGPSAGTTLTLINLNPKVGAWFVLDMAPAVGKRQRYHLENPDRAAQSVSLDERYPEGLLLSNPGGGIYACNLLGKSNGKESELEAARATKAPYARICEGLLFLLNETVGHESKKERAVAFLRNHVWGGESITTFFKEWFFRDSELLNSEVVQGAPPGGRSLFWHRRHFSNRRQRPVQRLWPTRLFPAGRRPPPRRPPCPALCPLPRRCSTRPVRVRCSSPPNLVSSWTACPRGNHCWPASGIALQMPRTCSSASSSRGSSPSRS